MNYIITTDELYHHGIQGQKWGVRRFQNKDGSLTSAGRKRYDDTEAAYKKAKTTLTRNKAGRAAGFMSRQSVLDAREKMHDAKKNFSQAKKQLKLDKKLDNEIFKIREDRERFNSGASKHLDKMIERHADKLDKLKNKSEEKFEKKQAKYERKEQNVKDYISSMNKGYKKYESILKNFGEVKAKSLTDSSYKYGSEYTKAAKEYVNLKLQNAYNVNFVGTLPGRNTRTLTVMSYAKNT